MLFFRLKTCHLKPFCCHSVRNKSQLRSFCVKCWQIGKTWSFAYCRLFVSKPKMRCYWIISLSTFSKSFLLTLVYKFWSFHIGKFVYFLDLRPILFFLSKKFPKNAVFSVKSSFFYEISFEKSLFLLDKAMFFCSFWLCFSRLFSAGSTMNYFYNFCKNNTPINAVFQLKAQCFLNDNAFKQKSTILDKCRYFFARVLERYFLQDFRKIVLSAFKKN